MAVLRGVGRIAALAVVVAALSVGGCGRRGGLEPAPDPNQPFAIGNPKPQQDSKSGLQRRPSNPKITPPNEPFLLDPLL